MIFLARTLTRNILRNNYGHLRLLQQFRSINDDGEPIPIHKRMKFAEYYKRMDGLDPNFELIYSMQMYFAYPFYKLANLTVATVAVGACAYNIIAGALDLEGLDVLQSLHNSEDRNLMLAIVLPYTLLFWGCLDALPMRIYENDKRDYVAVMTTINPFRAKRILFKTGDLVQNDQTWFPKFKQFLYKLNNKRIILLPHRFKTPSHLFKMLPFEQSRKYGIFK